MTFKTACTLDDLWEGDMTEVEIDGHAVLLVWPEGGEVRAFQGMCPHQDIPLAEGKLSGRVLMCRAHQWTFDATTGAYTGPLTKLAGFGKVPVPVAEVCTITWYCNATTFGDIHANTTGYNFIGQLIVAKLASL